MTMKQEDKKDLHARRSERRKLAKLKREHEEEFDVRQYVGRTPEAFRGRTYRSDEPTAFKTLGRQQK